MEISLDVAISGSRKDVWKVITDVENAAQTISGIEKIEVLEKPADGLIGLKWRETRTLFGKTATEVMWITDVKENTSYQTRAESHGAVYVSGLSIADEGRTTRLTMTFRSFPQTFGAKMMAAIMGVFFKKATVNALRKDLEDIKKAVEAAG